MYGVNGNTRKKKLRKRKYMKTREPLGKGDSCTRISIKKSFTHIIKKFTTKKKNICMGST